MWLPFGEFFIVFPPPICGNIGDGFLLGLPHYNSTVSCLYIPLAIFPSLHPFAMVILHIIPNYILYDAHIMEHIAISYDAGDIRMTIPVLLVMSFF